MHNGAASKPAPESKWENVRELNYADITKATKDFDSSMSIGDGASCKVYQGNLSGVDCAIKVLTERADALDKKQFISEMMLLARVKHENICCLIGCSFNGPRQCLALELMQTDLADRLYSVQSHALGWEQKVFIAVCICRGVCHLHNLSPPMIHRYIHAPFQSSLLASRISQFSFLFLTHKATLRPPTYSSMVSPQVPSTTKVK
jgi:serine/threonine protein kinase